MHDESSSKIRFALLVESMKSRRLINDQVLGKILYNSMSISNNDDIIGCILILIRQDMVH